MKFSVVKSALPELKSVVISVIAALLLISAFPDFEFWYAAYFAFVPLLFAVKREKDSFAKSAMTGWIFGTIFFFGTCWWLTFAPITYAGVPAIITYFLLLGAASIIGIFPAIFTALLSLFLRRFETRGFLAVPFLWTAIEFLRFWMTGNNWNAIAYSQAFGIYSKHLASVGGIYLVGFYILSVNIFLFAAAERFLLNKNKTAFGLNVVWIGSCIGTSILVLLIIFQIYNRKAVENNLQSLVIAVQPNVPMGGMKYAEWSARREKHIELAEKALNQIKSSSATTDKRLPITVVFPESPMNFGYTNDLDFQMYLRDFTQKHNVRVLYNAAEPTADGKGFYNSAVLVDENAQKIAQYDKIYLVPFGEYVPLPAPLSDVMPTMVGNFAIGNEYDILPFGDAKAGIMICFESHFPTLSRQFVLNGADVLIEMTNDGYLGETPVLRQHLANAVFRAVETNRPVLRVTNVGITGYIDELGNVSDMPKPYTEDVRVRSIHKSDGAQTFYVRYGDWFARLCSLVSLTLLFLSFRNSKNAARD